MAANAHGLLMVHNEDTVEPGEGFDRHHHQNMEIITWVLEGAVQHQDSVGNTGTIRPGVVQRMSAGTGVLHSERNTGGYTSGQRLRVVQMWLPPSVDDVDPSYAERDVTADLQSGNLVVVASGLERDRGALTIGNRHAALHVARLQPGQSVAVPVSPFGHVFFADGSATVDEVGAVSHGDAIRLTDTGGQRITAVTACEVLVWEMYAATR